MHPSVLYWNYRNRIAFAPPGEGGGGDGGEGADGNETQEGGEGNDTLEGGDSNKDDEINLDGLDLVTELFKDDTKEDDIPENPPDDIMTSAQMKEMLDNQLKQVSIPDDFIADDFNPNDRKQLKELLTKTLTLGIRHSLNMSFRPIENVMKLHAFQTDKSVRTRLKDMGSMNTESRSLEQEIPALNNPEHAELIKGVFNNAKKRFPGKFAQQVSAAKKALVVMGIDPMKSNNQSRQVAANGSMGVKRGASALDDFAPRPVARAAASTTRAMKP